MRIVRMFAGLLLLVMLATGIAYYLAGSADGPTITINQPAIVGQNGILDVTIAAPNAQLDAFSIQLEQRGRVFPILSSDSASPGSVSREEPGRLRIRHPIGRKWLPDLQSGAATISVAATRPVLRGLRQVSSAATREVQVRLDPPRIGVISSHHYINVGGTEMIVYRVTPPDAESGVQVGELTYPGFAAAGAGVAADAGVKVAFFALLYNQKPDTPMALYATDSAGNEARAQFEHRVFPKAFRNSRIAIDDGFLSRVVPQILEHSPQVGTADGDLLPVFLKINNDLRRTNNETIAALARTSSPSLIWKGAFQPLGGSQVESAFADARTYLYGGKDIDRQVHLGFDLAKTANTPVAAANDGRVIYAGDLGIYGNCVILDHGMGVQSLYGHFSSLQVAAGRDVRKGDVLGLSGQTGLAGGDHLHFSMLVNGRFVNATEWWDQHWIDDRIVRKFREAAVSAP